MAKLDDSIVSHVSITSESPADRNTADEAARMQELQSGIEAREKLLQAKQR